MKITKITALLHFLATKWCSLSPVMSPGLCKHGLLLFRRKEPQIEEKYFERKPFRHGNFTLQKNCWWSNVLSDFFSHKLCDFTNYWYYEELNIPGTSIILWCQNSQRANDDVFKVLCMCQSTEVHVYTNSFTLGGKSWPRIVLVNFSVAKNYSIFHLV